MEGAWKWLIGAVAASLAFGSGWVWYQTGSYVPNIGPDVEETQPDGSKWTGDLIRDKLDPMKEQP